MIANGRLVCNESESFMVNEGYKLLEGNVATGIILQSENRIPSLVPGAESSPVCQEVVGKLEMAGIEMMGGKIERENVVRCQDASSNTVSLLAREEPKDDLVKKSTSVYSTATAGCYGSQACDGGVLVSEKRIEITGYYHKDVATAIEEDRHAEKDDTPPPLPLTGKISHPRSIAPSIMFPCLERCFLIRSCFRSQARPRSTVAPPRTRRGTPRSWTRRPENSR